MKRRTLLASALAVPFAAGAAESAGWRRYEVTTRVELLDSPGEATLWLPLVQTAAGYQAASVPRVAGNGAAEVVRDGRYGAAVLRARWAGPARAGQAIEVVQVVETRDRGVVGPASLTPAERALWTAATPSVPTDGIVRETAERITVGRGSARDRLRAIYDWVVETTWRDPHTPGCGTGDFKTMLRTGKFGGKCADINGLMTGLARAAGFPARDVYGIRVAESDLFPALGKSGDVSRAQHCRSEVFLDGVGWFPVDPADVRKVVLEGRLPVDGDRVLRIRDRLFGNWEMNWVGYNSATDIALPGAAPGQRPDFPFLMYPCAFTAMGEPDCLDPKRFRYEIDAREV